METIDIFSLFARLALSAGFFSAVAARFNLWGQRASFDEAWQGFVKYTAEVNSFLPVRIIPALAILATVLEISFGLLLLVGYKTSYAGWGAGFLLLAFALAMTASSGIKEPLDYSVFAASAAAFLLAVIPQHNWSIDQLINN